MAEAWYAVVTGHICLDIIPDLPSVGACNVEAADALGGLRSWDERQARVAQGCEHHDLVISADGWRHDGDYGLWECAAKVR